MKEKSNATLRRAASLRCRTDAAIARLGRAVACYQRGAITTAELLREASAAADRAGTLELSAAEYENTITPLHPAANESSTCLPKISLFSIHSRLPASVVPTLYDARPM